MAPHQITPDDVLKTKVSTKQFDNSSRIVTTQPVGHELSLCDWSPSVIRIIPHSPPGFEVLRTMDSLHLKELVRLSDENHYHAFDQNDRKKRIFTIKGKDNWFDGESLSLYDSEKTEILTASTHTKDMLQVIDCEETEVARIIVSSNICVTGDMIDLKFFLDLDVRLKAALLAATVIIHLASGVTTTKQAGV